MQDLKDADTNPTNYELPCRPKLLVDGVAVVIEVGTTLRFLNQDLGALSISRENDTIVEICSACLDRIFLTPQLWRAWVKA
jgi:hypothetical protein